MFQKGQSGNPNGRPKLTGDRLRVIDIARAHTDKAINTLVSVMTDEDATPAARVAAAQALLDRGWGKPVQPIDGDGEGGAIALDVIRRVIVDPKPRDA